MEVEIAKKITSFVRQFQKDPNFPFSALRSEYNAFVKHILLAEDEAFLKETIQLELESHGVMVHAVMNGEDAIADIAREQPALLLLDLLMPKKDGYVVLQYIREHGYDFPVIILSNLSNEMDREKCLTLGAKDYFIKSDMDEDELWPKIQSYLTEKAPA